MGTKSSRFWVTIVAVFFSFCIIFQAQARDIHKNSENVYNFDDDSINTSIRLGLGYLTGTANEYVYRGSYSENLLSQLIWDIDEQYMAGLGFSLQRQWVAIHGDIWMGITDGDGTMDDYDWALDGYGWSHWSHHDDTIVTNAQILDINAEFLLPMLSTDHFVLSVFLGYQYENYEWEARNGSYIYSVMGWRDTVGTLPARDLAVSYGQKYKTPYIGVGLRGNVNKFEFSGRFIGSPLVSSSADDMHHMRNFKTKAKMSDGNMYEFDVSTIYNFTEKYSLKLTYNYTSYDTMRGNSIYTEVIDEKASSTEWVDAEGMDLERSLISLAFTYIF